MTAMTEAKASLSATKNEGRLVKLLGKLFGAGKEEREPAFKPFPFFGE